MRVIVTGEEAIRVGAGGEGLEIELATPGLYFSPLHMLAASLAGCTLAVLHSWAMQGDLSTAGLEVALAWEYVENPFRVGRYDLTLHWPGLPEGRRAAARRVAEHCTVENTLRVPPEIRTEVEG
jgi:uncharacterized OsmC-like protein